ncbi:MAG: hypothetical protein N2511_01610 [Thermodesulfovibrionales bacterium]|nr:hypothetical protein [Thermodesulfovibrionales bacterium]
MIGINEEFKTMILEYMQKGFLENIVDMFKHDRSLYPLIIDMIKDERIKVRIGAFALVEELLKDSQKELLEIIPLIKPLLNDPNPTIRGDADYLIEILTKDNDLRK